MDQEKIISESPFVFHGLQLRTFLLDLDYSLHKHQHNALFLRTPSVGSVLGNSYGIAYLSYIPTSPCAFLLTVPQVPHVRAASRVSVSNYINYLLQSLKNSHRQGYFLSYFHFAFRYCLHQSWYFASKFFFFRECSSALIICTSHFYPTSC